jgi:hypothetical protein
VWKTPPRAPAAGPPQSLTPPPRPPTRIDTGGAVAPLLRPNPTAARGRAPTHPVAVAAR